MHIGEKYLVTLDLINRYPSTDFQLGEILELDVDDFKQVVLWNADRTRKMGLTYILDLLRDMQAAYEKKEPKAGEWILKHHGAWMWAMLEAHYPTLTKQTRMRIIDPTPTFEPIKEPDVYFAPKPTWQKNGLIFERFGHDHEYISCTYDPDSDMLFVRKADQP